MLWETGTLRAVLTKEPGNYKSMAPFFGVSSNIEELEDDPQVIKANRKCRWMIALTMSDNSEYQINIQNSRMEVSSGWVAFQKGQKFIAVPSSAFSSPKEAMKLGKYTLKTGVWKVYEHYEYLDSRKTIVVASNRLTKEKVVAKRIPKFSKNQTNESILLELCNFHTLSGCLNTVQFLEAYESSEEVTIIMEYFSTITVTDLITQRRLKEYQAVEILIQLLEFLVDANRSGYSHRDLKPDNILVKENKREMSYTVKVIDFGLSQKMSQPLGERINQFCGTPGFAAPEIFLGHDYGMNIDIFSLGCVFYCLLTGSFLFQNEKHLQTIKDANKRCDCYKQLRDLYGRCSPSSFELLVKMLEKDPKKRIGSLEALDFLVQQDKNFPLVELDLADYDETMEEGLKNI